LPNAVWQCSAFVLWEVEVADGSAIEWTDATWNPVTGCTKITAGCVNCYAARFSERFRGVAGHAFETGFDLTLRPERLAQPLAWRRPRMIFVNSMSDLFHKEVPRTFIDQVFDTMEKADHHTFQVLTKRSSLMRDYLKRRYGKELAPKHIWLGVSVEDAAAASRIRHLQQSPANVRFISAEPLIGPIGQVDLTGVHWLIAGGESGPGARVMHIDWARDIRDQCAEQDVAFFFKQWGGFRPKTGGRDLDGRQWNELPMPVASRAA
jgi:protein gp37